MQQYMKNPPTYEVIHFTGGRKNGTEIVKLMNERGLTARWIEEVRPTEDGTAVVEEILFNNQSFPLNTWVVFEGDSRRPELYGPDEFAHRFTPVQEFTEETFFASDESSLQYTQDGVEEAKVSENVPANVDGFRGELRALINKYSLESDTGTPDFILANFAVHTLIGLTDFVHHRAKWRGESLELPALQKLRMNSQYGKVEKIDVVSPHPNEELTEITNGVIDSVPEDIKTVEYDEVTASKVLEIIVEHIPTMSIRKATDLVKAFKHAGVLV